MKDNSKMREIKFMAWDKEEKRMEYNPGVKRTEDWLAPELNELIKHCQEDENYILMQYIGRKDKNGREIYGDFLIEIKNVITGADWPGPGFVIEKLIVPVVWDEENALWSFDIENEGRYSDYYDKNDKYARINFRNHIRELMLDGESGEIVGNIYENPELLK